MVPSRARLKIVMKTPAVGRNPDADNAPICTDGSAVSCKKTVTGMCPAFSQTEAWIDTQIGAGVEQEARLADA